jgi:hypothetical protein
MSAKSLHQMDLFELNDAINMERAMAGFDSGPPPLPRVTIVFEEHEVPQSVAVLSETPEAATARHRRAREHAIRGRYRDRHHRRKYS